MPRYVYVCPDKHTTEAVHKMAEVIILYCPVCGAIMTKSFNNHVAIQIMPSQSPAIKEHLDRVNEKRERYEEKHG